ncbi:MAG TPA: hypothetical protein VD907_06235 [Verrucomicrobiae bacterium]|nr:hypothetical protein [Verrucomicrobiae bacterium]
MSLNFGSIYYMFHELDARAIRDSLVPKILRSTFAQLMLGHPDEEFFGKVEGITYKLNNQGRRDRMSALLIERAHPFTRTEIETREAEFLRLPGFHHPRKLVPYGCGDDRLNEALLDRCYSDNETWQQVTG